jgi:hypothetical protein
MDLHPPRYAPDVTRHDVLSDMIRNHYEPEESRSAGHPLFSITRCSGVVILDARDFADWLATHLRVPITRREVEELTRSLRLRRLSATEASGQPLASKIVRGVTEREPCEKPTVIRVRIASGEMAVGACKTRTGGGPTAHSPRRRYQLTILPR